MTMRVRVSSQAEEVTRRAQQAFSYLPFAMGAMFESAAAELRDTDAYQDRTGNLRSHTTGGVTARDDNSVQCDLKMGEPYASYVVKRHYSGFEALVPQLSKDMNGLLNSFGKRISGDAARGPVIIFGLNLRGS